MTYKVCIQLPDYLLITLMRFAQKRSAAGSISYKKTNRVLYPNALNLNHLVQDLSDDCCDATSCTKNSLYSHLQHDASYTYKLKGVLCHRGTLNGGHYVFMDVNELNQYTLLNDNIVSTASDSFIDQTYGTNMREQDRDIFVAYMLLYEKDNVTDRFLPYNISRNNYNILFNNNQPDSSPLQSSSSSSSQAQQLSVPTHLQTTLSAPPTIQQYSADWDSPRRATASNPTQLEFDTLSQPAFDTINKQREDWKRLINVDAINNLPYDNQLIPKLLKYLHTSCDCRHGNRTINCCGHVAAALIYMLDLINHQEYQEENIQSDRWSSQVTNIEPFLDYSESDDEDDDDEEADM